jgi:putative transposase
VYEVQQPVLSKIYCIHLRVAGYIDVFTQHQYCDIVIDKLNYCVENKNLLVYEYVLMPGYLAMIATSTRSHLSKVLRDFKIQTAKEVLKSISESPHEPRKEWLMRLFHFYTGRYREDSDYHFWQFGNNPVDLDTPEQLQQKAADILNIPVAAKMVDHPGHYIYSSAHPGQQVRLRAWR